MFAFGTPHDPHDRDRDQIDSPSTSTPSTPSTHFSISHWDDKFTNAQLDYNEAKFHENALRLKLLTLEDDFQQPCDEYDMIDESISFKSFHLDELLKERKFHLSEASKILFSSSDTAKTEFDTYYTNTVVPVETRISDLNTELSNLKDTKELLAPHILECKEEIARTKAVLADNRDLVAQHKQLVDNLTFELDQYRIYLAYTGSPVTSPTSTSLSSDTESTQQQQQQQQRWSATQGWAFDPNEFNSDDGSDTPLLHPRCRSRQQDQTQQQHQQQRGWNWSQCLFHLLTSTFLIFLLVALASGGGNSDKNLKASLERAQNEVKLLQSISQHNLQRMAALSQEAYQRGVKINDLQAQLNKTKFDNTKTNPNTQHLTNRLSQLEQVNKMHVQTIARKNNELVTSNKLVQDLRKQLAELKQVKQTAPVQTTAATPTSINMQHRQLQTLIAQKDDQIKRLQNEVIVLKSKDIANGDKVKQLERAIAAKNVEINALRGKVGTLQKQTHTANNNKNSNNNNNNKKPVSHPNLTKQAEDIVKQIERALRQITATTAGLK